MVDAVKHMETWYRDLALEGVLPNPRKRRWGLGVPNPHDIMIKSMSPGVGQA